MRFVDRSVWLLGAGSLVFGAWGFIHPRSLTTLMAMIPLGRQLGMRDTAVGVALVAGREALPLCLRFASDLHDAVRLRERSRWSRWVQRRSLCGTPQRSPAR